MKNQKMQNRLLALTLCLALSPCFVAQDIMTLKNGDVQSVKVTEINQTEIKYRDFLNLEGPVRVIDKIAVFSIKYENGVKSVINTDFPSAISSAAVNKPEELEINKVSNGTNVKFDKDSSDFANIKSKRFGGPRIGLTFISSGTSADYLAERGKQPLITQFGWQFEQRLFTVDGGISGIVEFVPLIGGIEQGMFIPSASVLIGMRGGVKHSYEFALGHNFSIVPNYKGNKEGMVSLVIAAGTNLKKGNINFQ